MITETLYKCEVCGNTWLTQQEAERCEASHQVAEFVTEQHFSPSDKYPDKVILTMANGHNIQYRYDQPILDTPSDLPYVRAINVSRNPQTDQVILTAIGYNLPTTTYTWVILFDDTRYVATSEEPTVTLSNNASRLFDIAFTVKVRISAEGIEEGQFVVKYTE